MAANKNNLSNSTNDNVFTSDVALSLPRIKKIAVAGIGGGLLSLVAYIAISYATSDITLMTLNNIKYSQEFVDNIFYAFVGGGLLSATAFGILWDRLTARKSKKKFKSSYISGSKLVSHRDILLIQKISDMKGVVISVPEELKKLSNTLAWKMFSTPSRELEIKQKDKKRKAYVKMFNEDKAKKDQMEYIPYTLTEDLNTEELIDVRIALIQTYTSKFQEASSKIEGASTIKKILKYLELEVPDYSAPKEAMSENAMPVKYNGILLNLATEVEGILVMGGTGSGKSVLLNDIYRQLLMRPDNKNMKCIIHDIKNDFVKYFFRKGIDLLFNMNDKNSLRFNLFVTIKQETDIWDYAATLIPEDSGKEPIWLDTAKNILFGAILYCIFMGLTTLYDLKRVTFWSHKKMINEFSKVKGMEKTLLTLGAADTQVLNYLSNFGSKLKLFDGVPDEYLNTPVEEAFNPEEWLDKKGQSTIFITNSYKSKALNSSKIATFIQNMLDTYSDKQLINFDQDLKLYTILDEFGMIAKIPKFPDALKLFRSINFSSIVGIQGALDIERVYGKEDKETIINGLSSKMFFRLNEEALAEWASKTIGKQWYLDYSGGSASVAQDHGRNSKTFQTQKVHEFIVDGADIMAMKKHTFYFKQPDQDWVFIDRGFNHIIDRLIPLNEGFVPFDNIDLDIEKMDINYIEEDFFGGDLEQDNFEEEKIIVKQELGVVTWG